MGSAAFFYWFYPTKLDGVIMPTIFYYFHRVFVDDLRFLGLRGA